MIESSQDPKSPLPLSPAVFHILLALADGDRHGYGIMLEVEARTEGQVRLGPGTLYGAIKRLLERGIIEETDERADPALNEERRRYYRLTGFGRQVLRAETGRLSRLLQQAGAKDIWPDLAPSPDAGAG